MANKYPFSKIKKHILKNKSLKFEGLEKENLAEKNPEEFLESFFSKYNTNYNTIYAESGAKQTGKSKRRSIADIYKIIIYYFPNASLTKTYKRLIELIKNDKVCSAYCTEINRRVYRTKKENENSFFNSVAIDEYGVDFLEFNVGNINMNENDIGWGAEYGLNEIQIIKL